MKNLALLLCFLGFGIGCALARQRPRWQTAATALLGLILIVRLPWRGAQIMETLSQYLGAAQDIEIWATRAAHDATGYLFAVFVTIVLLLFITYIFIPIGQTVSRQIELAPRPLYGYSWNLAGSLAGILVFFAVSWMALPPVLWFTAVLAAMALLQSNRSDQIRIAAAVLPVAFLLFDPSTPSHFNLWTPYQQIEVQDESFSNGELSRTQIRVNHTGYQVVVNLSPGFLARHPALLTEAPDDNPYNLPFRFAPPNPRVLIVGSGTGNDVAAALRHQSRAVDAVEIDPKILDLGRRRHPEHPYDDPRVSAHLTDARAFMKRATAHYDLILFGLLDSHTQLSDYAGRRPRHGLLARTGPCRPRRGGCRGPVAPCGCRGRGSTVPAGRSRHVPGAAPTGPPSGRHADDDRVGDGLRPGHLRPIGVVAGPGQLQRRG